MFWGKRLVMNNLNSIARYQKILGIICSDCPKYFFWEDLLRPDRILGLSFFHNLQWFTYSSGESEDSSAEIHAAGNLCFKCIFKQRKLCYCFPIIILETWRSTLNLYGYKYLVFSFHTLIIAWLLIETNFSNVKASLFLGHTFHFLLVRCCI